MIIKLYKYLAIYIYVVIIIQLKNEHGKNSDSVRIKFLANSFVISVNVTIADIYNH